MSKATSYPLPLADREYARAARIARKFRLPIVDVLRRSVKAGLPVVDGLLGGHAVVAVAPWPKGALARAYQRSKLVDAEYPGNALMSAQAFPGTDE